MYERIVVGTDGSERAHDAVRRAAELTRLTDADLHLVSACDPVRWEEIEEIRRELPDEFRDLITRELDAEDRLRLAHREVDRSGVRATDHPRTGDPASAILDVAREVEADLVVVGARGLGALARFLRGSVSTRVAHHSPCDVLVVEHDEIEEAS